MNEILLLLLIGICAGVLGGMAGVGGGIIIVPALVFFLGFSQHMAQGTSTATLLFPIGIFAAFNYYKAGNVNWKFAILMAIGFMAGSWLGSKLAIQVNGRMLKRGFAFFVLFVAIKMLYDSFKTQP